MTYIIAEPCVDVRDRACVKVCPVDCIYEIEATQFKEGDPGYKMTLYIHPSECIDCGACEPVCPVTAIFIEEEVPDKWKSFIEKNRVYFKK